MTQLLEQDQPASLIMEAVKGPLVIKTGDDLSGNADEFWSERIPRSLLRG